MGVISACIPSLRPLVSLLLRGTVRGLGVTKSLSGKQTSPNSSSGRSRRSSGNVWQTRSREGDCDGFAKMDGSVGDPKSQSIGHNVEVLGGRVVGRGPDDEISLEAVNLPDGIIQVKDEVTVTSSGWLDYQDKVF